MSNDAKDSSEPSLAAWTTGASTPVSPESAVFADAALHAIGYEAADPALHAPLWGEAMLAGTATRSLR